MRIGWKLVLLGIGMSVLSLEAKEVDKQILSLYLNEATKNSADKEILAFLVSKILAFESTSSDALYWASTLENQLALKLRLLQKALKFDSWLVISPTQALADYMNLMLQTGHSATLLKELTSMRSRLERSSDLLYPYAMALKSQGDEEGFGLAIDTAWLIYQSEVRFWPYFLERESYFSPFLDYLEKFEHFSASVLQTLLRARIDNEAHRHAFLLMLKDKNEGEATLTVHLSLNGLIAQDEALRLLKEQQNLKDLSLCKAFYESLKDPLLKEEWANWLNDFSGTFYWKSVKSEVVDNWLTVSKGIPIEWVYTDEFSVTSKIHFKGTQPISFSKGSSVEVHYGLYPFVDFVCLRKGTKETVYRLGTGILSLPLAKGTFIRAQSLPIFFPLESHLITYDLANFSWLSYTVKKEELIEGKLRQEEEYIHGKLIRRSFVNSFTGVFDRWDYFENGNLVYSQRDLNGSGYPEITVFYLAEGKGRYVLLDDNGDGITDFLYYQDPKICVQYWDLFEKGEIDSLFVKDKLKERSYLIPLDSPEAKPWRTYPKRIIRE